VGLEARRQFRVMALCVSEQRAAAFNPLGELCVRLIACFLSQRSAQRGECSLALDLTLVYVSI